MTRKAVAMISIQSGPPEFEDFSALNKQARIRRILQLAKDGKLEKVHPRYLTPSYVTVLLPGEVKATIHYAAEDGSISRFSNSVFKPANLLLKDMNGQCACDHLLEARTFWRIPKSYYTENNLGQNSRNYCHKLLTLIKCGRLACLPRKRYNRALLETQLDDFNFIENVCRYGGLEHIPERLLTFKILGRRYNTSDTALVLAAEDENLYAVPTKVLRDPRISRADKMKILDAVIRFKTLELLPDDFITSGLVDYAREQGKPVAPQVATHGLAITLKLMPSKSISIEELPEFAARAVSNGHIEIGALRHWHRHFKDTPLGKLYGVKTELPDPLRFQLMPILREIRKTQKVRSKLHEAIQQINPPAQ